MTKQYFVIIETETQQCWPYVYVNVLLLFFSLPYLAVVCLFFTCFLIFKNVKRILELYTGAYLHFDQVSIMHVSCIFAFFYSGVKWKHIFFLLITEFETWHKKEIGQFYAWMFFLTFQAHIYLLFFVFVFIFYFIFIQYQRVERVCTIHGSCLYLYLYLFKWRTRHGVKQECINRRKKNSVPCGIQSRDLWISGYRDVNNNNTATNVAMVET